MWEQITVQELYIENGNGRVFTNSTYQGRKIIAISEIKGRYILRHNDRGMSSVVESWELIQQQK